MSLAITAAPFDSDNQNYSELNSDDTPVNRKRQTTTSSHNKTQKRMPAIDLNSEKVNSVLQSIHNNSGENELGDFNPKRNQASVNKANNQINQINPLTTNNKLLAPPESMRNQSQEGFNNYSSNSNMNSSNTNSSNTNSSNTNSSSPLIPSPLDNSEMELQELQSAFLNDAQVRDYYKKLVPNFQNKPMAPDNTNKGYYKERSIDQQSNGLNMYGSNNDVLLNKINYMINLLEDQQDERTNNVTEEVVLYSFLGIFIIFVVDSFARVGKYTR
jgi:hypothetical protein